MGLSQRISVLTVGLTLGLTFGGLLAAPGAAWALSAGDVTLGGVNVATSGSASGAVSYNGTAETLASFDTTGCTGFAITPGETLPKAFASASDTLAFTAQYTAAARGAATCAVTLRAADASDLGTFSISATGVAAELSVSATALTFGEVKITGGTDTRTFNVSNTGDLDHTLTVSGISASGGATTDFSASPTSFTVAAGASQLITVTFDPSATGARATDLVVTSDDPVTATETLALTGTGVNPVIATAEDPTDFGVVVPGGMATRNIAVSNVGSGTLTVMSAATNMTVDSWFSFTAVPTAGCDGNKTCPFSPVLAITNAAVNVALRCQPPVGATGTQTRTLTFTSDSAAGGDNIVTLTCAAGNPMISAAPTSMAFGNVELGLMSTPQTLTVTNTGNQPLLISTAALLGGTDFAVAVGQGGAQTVMPGNNVTWNLVCYPTVEGPLSDTFRISSNASNAAQLDVPLACTGGRLVSNVTSFDFGAVRAYDTVTRTFTLRNTGPVTVSGITATFSAQAGAKGYSLDTATLPASLAANSSAVVTVRFTPTDTDSGTAQTLRISGTYGAAQATMTKLMALTGDGLSAGYTFDPPTLDLGAVRWDMTTTKTFQIKNPFEAPVRLTGLTVVPRGTTVTGEITQVGLLVPPAGQPTSFPLTLASNEAVTVTLRADPNARIGALTADVMINSNLGAGGMPMRTLAVTATSTSPMITADPPTMMYDFGPVDVDVNPATKTLSLKNTGDGVLDVSTATIVGGNARYTVTAVTPATVAPNDMFTVTVAYDPSAVATTTGSLVIGVGGIISGTMTATFQLSGRGIDRRFAVTEPGLFPETYRNPGSKAPIQDVLVQNLGEAPLTISAVMVTGEPVWSVVDPAPVVVPGNGSTIFKVRFAPTTGGKAPTGSLVLSHDDDTTSNRAIVMLEGFGKNPMLSVAPSASISLGTTAVGFPVRLSETFPDQLTVQNNDTATFRVREVRLRDASGQRAFELTDDLSGQELAPGETRRFDIVFSAATVGEFEAQMEIYLEEDTEPATIVQVTGTAVEVEVQGGGGCQTSDPGGGLLPLLLGACAIGWRRRRRRAATARALVALAALAVLGSAGRAQAQASRNIDLTTFRPAPATGGDLLAVESPTVGATGDWELGLAISHLRDPLQVTTSMGDTFNLVSQRTVFDLGLAVAFAHRVELGARIATMSQDGDADGATVRGLERGPGSAMSDALLHGKVRVLGGPALGLAAAVNVTLPTATDNAFAGPGSVGGSGMVLIGGAGRRLSASANLGFAYQEQVTLGNITQGNRALGGVGAAWRASDAISLSAEVFGAVAIGQRERRAASPVEALLGVRYHATRTVGISLGLGTGVVRGIGAPAMHGVLAFDLAPNAAKLEPLRPPAPYVPPADSDGDGIPDSEDHCVSEAEDLDGFGDADGCPDPDNDFDGIVDSVDKCPSKGEDKDGFQDDDGCPDLDDDGDGVLAPADQCPAVAEDQDGFQDDDGCPDPDDDHDGLLDGVDKCPREPETINGNQDDDGCPDPGATKVLVDVGRIDLIAPIAFIGQGSKLTSDAQGILGQVAATLRANPEIVRLRIGVHVNQRNARDKELTERRAAAVRDWLVQWGIAADRLDVRGFGSERMIVKPKRKNANLVNNRVELTIMERK